MINVNTIFSFIFMGHTRQNITQYDRLEKLTPPPHTHMHLYNTHTNTHHARYKKKKKECGKMERRCQRFILPCNARMSTDTVVDVLGYY
jgi:hypothetical protein